MQKGARLVHTALYSVLAAASPQQIERTRLIYLAVAFALTWVVISAYLLSLFRRQKRLEEALEKIQAQANHEQSKLAPDNKSAE